MKQKKIPTGYLFLTPFVIGFLVFGLYPVLNTLGLSFTNTTLMSKTSTFVGLDNFKRLFADAVFLKAVGNTWLIWSLNFIPQIGFALLLSAMFTNARLNIKAKGVWRAVFYLPNLMMPAAVTALFAAIFNYYGPANQILVRSGFLSEALRFFDSVAIARGMVVFINWWTWFGQTMIIVMAGMTSIPLPLYEAAMVDGASAWQMFTRITLPLLKPILVFIFVTALTGGMQMFDIPYLLTDGRGAPESSIQTSAILMFLKFNSSKGHIGAASSVGVLVFIMTTVCALGIFYFLRDKDMEDAKPTKKSIFKKNAERTQS
jgi:multiple sugar transport system permease protein